MWSLSHVAHPGAMFVVGHKVHVPKTSDNLGKSWKENRVVYPDPTMRRAGVR